MIIPFYISIFYFWLFYLPFTLIALGSEDVKPLVRERSDFGTLYVGRSYTKRIFITNFNTKPVHDIKFEFSYNGVFDRRRPLYNHDCPEVLAEGTFCYFTMMFEPSFGTLRGKLIVYWDMDDKEHHAASIITGLVTFPNP